MGDLVSRQEVKKELAAEYNRRFMAGDRGGLKMAWIEKAVDDVPSAQTEIIRCSNCIHGGYDVFDRGMWCKLHPEIDVTENDFCSKAERENNG